MERPKRGLSSEDDKSPGCEGRVPLRTTQRRRNPRAAAAAPGSLDCFPLALAMTGRSNSLNDLLLDRIGLAERIEEGAQASRLNCMGRRKTAPDR